jgi:hypothetical protein
MTFAYARTVPEMYVQELCQHPVQKLCQESMALFKFYHGKLSQVKQIKKLFCLLTLPYYSAILRRPAQTGMILA